jgi:cell division protein FtsA
VPIEEAEKMKLDPNYALTVKRKLDEIIEARLIDMFEIIESHLKKIGRNGLLPAGIVIVGGGAHVDDIERLAKESLRLPAKIFDPLTDPYLKSQIKDSGWAVAYGLCLWGLDSEISESSTQKIKQVSRRFMRWIKEFWP